MIAVKIGGEERQLENASEQWITQQINRRRQDGLSVCIQVSIQQGSLNLLLSTPTCASSGGGNRTPNREENEVLDLWRQRGLSNAKFSAGNIVSFLKQMKQPFG